MYRSFKKASKIIHICLSLPAGIIITIVCITGAALVYQTQIEQIIYPDRYFNSHDTKQTMQWEEWIQKVKNNLQNDSIVAITIHNQTNRSATIKLASAPRKFASVNRHNAEIQTIYNTREDLFYSIKKIHRWLTDESRTTGRYIVGTSSIFLAIILCSGIIFALPRKLKSYSKLLSLNLKKGPSRALFDLHKTLGIYTLPILITLAITGPIWSFTWYYKAAATVMNIQSQGQEPKNEITKTHITNPKEWAKALTLIENKEPNTTQATIQMDGKAHILTNKSIHNLATNIYNYNSKKQTLSLISKYGDKRDDRYMMGWVDVIHSGKWGGKFIQFITFIAAIIGASLPITGYILYFRKRIKRRHNTTQQTI